jgi:predicted DNA-binding protein
MAECPGPHLGQPLHANMCNTENMPRLKDRNLTMRLPVGLLRRLKAESAVEGVSMNAYIERLLEKALNGSEDHARHMAAMRLLARAKDGLYEIRRPLTREEMHDRRA